MFRHSVTRPHRLSDHRSVTAGREPLETRVKRESGWWADGQSIRVLTVWLYRPAVYAREATGIEVSRGVKTQRTTGLSSQSNGQSDESHFGTRGQVEQVYAIGKALRDQPPTRVQSEKGMCRFHLIRRDEGTVFAPSATDQTPT